VSIVAVHGPNTFGSKAIAEAGPIQALPNQANGLQWTFRLDSPSTRLDADFSWAFPPNGTPTPQTVKAPTIVTYATAGSKTATLTVTGAGAGANPFPPAGSYPITITAVSGTGQPGVSLRSLPPEGDEGEGEEQEVQAGYDPAAHTVTEVIGFVEDNPDQLEAVLAAEEAGKERSTLISHLESMRSS
jgi:hypothetical protein